MAKLQVADNQTLESIKNKLNNPYYGLEELKSILDKTPTSIKSDIGQMEVESLTKRIETLLISRRSDIVSQEEFLQILEYNSRPPVGTVIILNNQLTENKAWLVVGKEHDGVSNTVDLMPVNSINTEQFDDSSSNYSNSNIRTWLNNTFVSGFDTEVQNILKTMEVSTNISGTITKLSDKVKLPSAFELGIISSSSVGLPSKEGNTYSIFEKSYNRIKQSSTGLINWITRSRNTSNTSQVIGINTSGAELGVSYSENTVGIIPIIRL